MVSVDMTKVNETLVKMASIERYGLSEFCKTQAITAVENIELCQPVVTAFDLPDAIETILMPLADAFQSSVFRQLWENQCNQCVDECTSLELIPRLIWKPVSERYTLN